MMDKEIKVSLERFNSAKQSQDEIDQQIVSLREMKSELLKERADKKKKLESLSSNNSDGLIYGESKALSVIAKLKGDITILEERVAAIDTKIKTLKGQLADAYFNTHTARKRFNSLYSNWLGDEALSAIENGLLEALKPAAGFIKVKNELVGGNVESDIERLIINTLSKVSRSTDISELVLLPGAEKVVFQRYKPISLSEEEAKLLNSPAGRHALKARARTQ